MPLYKYDLIIRLNDKYEAFALWDTIHAAVCDGVTEPDETGAPIHKCGREWECMVSGFEAILPDPPEAPQPPVEALAEDLNAEG